jgi:putative hydrolase of the HAD superfamily
MDYFEIRPEPGLWNGLFDAYTTTILEVPPVFVEGLEGILKELAARFKLALICNTGRTPGWVVRKVLSRQGFERYFNTLIFSNEVGVAKPNPYIFEIAARVLEVQPGKTLHVGDSLITDVAGASGAGFRAGWYNPARIDKKVECDVVLWDFSDILKIQ